MYNGQYYYARHRNMWGVWQHETLADGMSHGRFVDDFVTRAEARAYVFRANGWKEVKNE